MGNHMRYNLFVQTQCKYIRIIVYMIYGKTITTPLIHVVHEVYNSK